MFDNLSEKLSGILDGLTRRGALSEQDVDAAQREVRRPLLEADVAHDVARAYIDQKSRPIAAASRPATGPATTSATRSST